jgi:hypothetical protein
MSSSLGLLSSNTGPASLGAPPPVRISIPSFSHRHLLTYFSSGAISHSSMIYQSRIFMTSIVHQIFSRYVYYGLFGTLQFGLAKLFVNSQATPELSTVISSSAGVLVADIHGSIHLLNRDFESINSWIAHVGGRVTHMIERRGILVTLGVCLFLTRCTTLFY